MTTVRRLTGLRQTLKNVLNVTLQLRRMVVATTWFAKIKTVKRIFVGSVLGHGNHMVRRGK